MPTDAERQHERQQEIIRDKLEDAVDYALEHGWDQELVLAEVTYVIDNWEEA